MKQCSEIHVVTGGAGFVAASLIPRLVERGHTVIAVDNLVRGRVEFLSSHIASGQVVFVQTDCADINAYRKLLQGALKGRQAAAVWHLAANSDIPAGVVDPNVDLKDTFMTTFNTLLLMKEFVVPILHFSSSSAIYGDFGDIRISEATAPYKPISNYGAMKLASEAQISAAVELAIEKANIFRFPNVIGAPATHGVIYDFIHKLRKDRRKLEVLGNGTQQKAYLHVADLVNAMLFIADRASEKLNIFNIGPRDSGVTVRFIAECVRDYIAPEAEIIYGQGNKGWAGDVPRFQYDTTLLSGLGWQPDMSSEEAVRLAVSEIARMI